MKKIALLFLITILVVGIQSCSKEETSIKEVELLDQDGLNATELERNPDAFCKVFVRYATYTDAFDRMAFLNWARQYRFSLILANTNTGCEFVEEWYVPCDELRLPPRNRGSVVIDGGKTVSDGTDDEPGEISFSMSINSFIETYDTCDQVPLLPPASL
ncbi:hypothetical protein [uncultured Lacinutrix sp.]|uniref:hypothetical protein n=1 Tax=uncultured Lacinutrix sp. TaxID=574032 RepID=UPI00262662C3|nr:hypothetical protein [uncultured Lacinutrix sp.]